MQYLQGMMARLWRKSGHSANRNVDIVFNYAENRVQAGINKEMQVQLSYKARITSDLARWREMGFLNQTSLEMIKRDVAKRRSGISFTAIIALLGIVSLCFAAITFVAANWDEMSRLLRVGILLGGLWLSYGLSVYFHLKRQNWLSQIFVLLGSALFGASIMLISQMYHLQGEQKDAILLWAAGTLIAALLMRSAPALVLAIVLFSIWHGFVLADFRPWGRGEIEINILYLPIWAIFAVGVWWLRSRIGAHFLALGGIFWLFTTMVSLAELNADPSYYIGAYLLLFLFISVLLAWREQFSRWMHGFEEAGIGYLIAMIAVSLSIFLTDKTFGGLSTSEFEVFQSARSLPLWLIVAAGFALAVFEWRKKGKHLYDVAFISAWILLGLILGTFMFGRVPFINEAYGLIISIWMIRMGARLDIAVISRIGYLLFSVIMLLIYFRTAGSLIGTAGFYLTTGVLMVFVGIFAKNICKNTQYRENSTMRTRYFLLAALIAGSLQTIALGSIIYDRAQKLITGQEVVLQSMMRDPRDLFRGHYTRLNLDVGELKIVEITVVGEFSYGDDVYVELAKGEDIFWIAKTLYAQNPQRADIALIKGRIISRANRTTYRISFPFDRYFAPKERALELEDIGRDEDRKLGIILALDGSGAGQIKGISIDDKLIYEEPLY